MAALGPLFPRLGAAGTGTPSNRIWPPAMAAGLGTIEAGQEWAQPAGNLPSPQACPPALYPSAHRTSLPGHLPSLRGSPLRDPSQVPLLFFPNLFHASSPGGPHDRPPPTLTPTLVPLAVMPLNSSLASLGSSGRSPTPSHAPSTWWVPS